MSNYFIRNIEPYPGLKPTDADLMDKVWCQGKDINYWSRRTDEIKFMGLIEAHILAFKMELKGRIVRVSKWEKQDWVKDLKLDKIDEIVEK